MKRPLACSDGPSSKPVQLLVPNLGPAASVNAEIEIILCSIQSFLSDNASAAVEICLTEEATGPYAATLTDLSSHLVEDKRFHLQYKSLGDLLDESLDSGSVPHVLACACNATFLARGDCPASRAVFKAAGLALTHTARLQYTRATVGQAYACSLPASSPLKTQGVRYVILTVPPFGVLDEPLPLDWHTSLAATYQAILSSFLSLVPSVVKNVRIHANVGALISHPAPTASPSSPSTTYCIEPLGSGTQALHTRTHADSADEASLVIPLYQHPGTRPPQGGGWGQGLMQYLKQPKANPAWIMMRTDEYLVIYDGYPKARLHLLVVPRPQWLRVEQVGTLKEQDLDRLKFLHAEAYRIANKLQADEPARRLRLGYHSIPSLTPLHLHVISEDFDSPCMKTKAHWNSFTTPFLISPRQVEEALATEGSFSVNWMRMAGLLRQSLRCHFCGCSQSNLPTLKAHVINCMSKQR